MSTSNRIAGAPEQQRQEAEAATRYLLEHEVESTCSHEEAASYSEDLGWSCFTCSAPYRVKGINQHALKAAYQGHEKRSLVSTPPPSTEQDQEREHECTPERQQTTRAQSRSESMRGLTHEDRAALDARAASALVDTLESLNALRQLAVEPAATLAIADRAIKAAKELHSIAQGGPTTVGASGTATVTGVTLLS